MHPLRGLVYPLLLVTFASFVLTPIARAQCPPTIELLTPSDGATGVDPTPVLSWNGDFAEYDIWLEQISGDTCPLSGPKATVRVSTFVTPRLADGTTYVWKIVGKKPGCADVASSCSQFTTVSSAPCPETGPTPLTPGNGAAIAEDPVHFSWSPVPNASKYHLIISANGETPHEIGWTTDDFLDANVPRGVIEWKVLAEVPNCGVKGSPLFSFVACPTRGPLPVEPNEGSTLAPGAVHFEWLPQPGMSDYSLWLSKNGAAAETAQVGSGTAADLTLDAGAYEWFVTAAGSLCPATESVHRHFLIQRDCPTAAAHQLEPPNGAENLPSPVSFSWRALDGATGYRLMLDKNGVAQELVVTTETTHTQPLPSGAYSWWIETLFADCPPTASPATTFSVAESQNCPTDSPSLVSPPNGAQDVPRLVDLSWTPVQSAVAYQLWISENGGAPFLLAETTETSHTALLEPASYAWAVRAIFAGCEATVSESWTFTTVTERVCPDEAPALLSPNDAATSDSPVAFSWGPVPQAIAYRLIGSLDGTAPSELATTQETSVSLPLPSGLLKWSVAAVFDGCAPTISTPRTVTITRSANCDANPAPSLTEPDDNAVALNPVTFRWNAANGAIEYQLWIVPAGGEPISLGFSGELEATRILPPGTFAWYVDALFAGCGPKSSEQRTITIEAAACDAPALLEPAPGASVAANVTFLWSEVEEAIEYRVWVGRDGVEPEMIGVTFGEEELTRPLPPGAWFWFVEAAFDHCRAQRSEIRFFIVKEEASCPAPADLLLPADGAASLPQHLEFSWTDVSGAVAYELLLSRNGGPLVASGESRTSSIELSLRSGEYLWSVVAFVPGCDLLQSEPRSFTIAPEVECQLGSPILLAPRHGARDLPSPIHFEWSAVDGAEAYDLFISVDLEEPRLVETTTATSQEISVPEGTIAWAVVARAGDCRAPSAISVFTSASATQCGILDQSRIFSVPVAPSGVEYPLRWDPMPGVELYELQESSDEAFTAPTSATVARPGSEFTHTVSSPTAFFYRVRGINPCDGSPGPFTQTIRVVVAPPPDATAREFRHVIGAGATAPVTQQLFIPSSIGSSFSVSVDRPWLSVTPSSGPVPPQGTTVSVSIDPAKLKPGTSAGTITISSTPAGKIVTNGDGAAIPVSASLASPVSSGGSGPPTSASLIIPAVAHAAGSNSQWRSDVRLSNVGAALQKFSLIFTPSGGTGTPKQTTIEIGPGDTAALDDVLVSSFGLGAAGESALGVLEIRPLGGSASSAAALASSRTYNQTDNGTYGQFIPAVPLSSFVGKGSKLTLQQIAHSSAYRTNLGLVEGSGADAQVRVSVFASAGNKLTDFTIDLKPNEHRQLDSVLPKYGIAELADGRIEIEVLSDKGKITAYASTVDNKTGDPILVAPAIVSSSSSKRFVIPGIADLNNGLASWRSDVRLFNSTGSEATATLTFYPQGSPGAPQAKDITVAPGEVKILDNILASLFGVTNAGGALHVTTPAATPLIVTARTYNQTSNGTYGQFIPSVAEEEGTAAGGQALQILQVEESERFRTNVGLAELSGAGATVELTVTAPDALAAPKKVVTLAPYEFVQFTQLLKQLHVETGYNARVSVRVTGGGGRVAAYASTVDNLTQDPTFVPAQ